MTPYRFVAGTKTPVGSDLTLHERDGEFFLRIDGHPLMTSRATASEERMVDLGVAGGNGEESARYLIGGLGLGFTLRRLVQVAKPEDVIEVAEVVPEVVDWNRGPLAEIQNRAVYDERVNVIVGDVFDQIQKAKPESYDAIFLDVDNGPMAMTQRENRRLYERKGFGAITHSLKKGGRAVFWSASRERAFAKKLRRAGFEVDIVAAKAYEKAKKPTHTLFVGRRQLD